MQLYRSIVTILEDDKISLME